MKVLGIVCSPRLHGNTELMVQESLHGAQEAGAEVELVTLAGKNIAFCDGCHSCRANEGCHIKDDMQDIYTKLLEADGIIFGTPVYYWSVSAQAKALIDRTFVLDAGSKLRNKVAGVVMTAQRSGVSGVVATFNWFFVPQRMVMVGWADGFTGDEGFTDKEAVKKDKKGMARAEALGEKVVEYIRSHQIPG